MTKQKPNVRPTRKTRTPEGYTVTVRKNRRRKLYYVQMIPGWSTDTGRNKAKGGFKTPKEAEAWAHAVSALEGNDNPRPRVTVSVPPMAVDHTIDAFTYAALLNSEN